MKKVDYGTIHHAGADKRLFELAQRATQQLEEVLGASGNLITAEWDRAAGERGRPLITLRLSDWAGAVTAQFAPDELEQSDRLRMRLHRLWGDLLQVRSHRQVEELLKAVEAPPGS